MSTLRTFNLQNPDSGTVNIEMDQGGNTLMTGIATVRGAAHFTSTSGSDAVGIGTDITAYKLDVRVTGAETGLRVYNPDTSSNASGILRLGNDDNQNAAFLRLNGSNNTSAVGGAGSLVLGHGLSKDLHLSTAGVSRLKITSGGNVGVGDDDPDVPFNVKAGGASFAGQTTHAKIEDTTSLAANVGGLLALEGVYNSGGAPAAFAMIHGGKENATDGNYAGYLRFLTRPSNALPQERLRITSAGYVGINDTSPASLFTVNNGTNDSHCIFIKNDNVGAYFGTYGTGHSSYPREVTINGTRTDSGSAPFLRIAGQGGIKFCVDLNTERLRIDSNGNLLLKTGEIDIQGGNKTVKTSAGFLQLGTSGSHHTAIITAGSERLRITSGGDLLLGGHSAYTYDDTGASNVILDIYGGATAGKRGILSLSGRVGTDNGDIGTIWFNNDNNSGSGPGNTMKLSAVIQAKITTSDGNSGSDAGAYMQFMTKPEGGSVSERLRITSAGSLLHKGNNSSTIDNTDGDGQGSNGYPAGGATFNKNISVNNNAGGFGQCMNMISHTKSITLNGSTNHDMVTIWNREGCFIGHVYAGYSTGGDGAVAMYKFNTFYSANSIIAELGPSSRSSDSISVNITSSGDSHTFRVNGNGYSGDVTIGLVFLSAGVAGTSAHYGVRYY